MRLIKIITILCVLVQISLAQSSEKYQGVDEFHFEELWVLALAGGAQATGQWAITYAMQEEFATANTENLPFWERPLVGRNVNWAAKSSSYILIFGAYPIVETLYKKNGQTAFYETMVLAELLFFDSGINLWVRSSALWPRPYYFEEGREGENDKPEILGAFYSGHASSTFALAMGWYQIKKMRSDTGVENWVAFGIAALSSSLRVVAGRHYVSDVVAGAVVGSLLGYFYPLVRIGESPFKFSVMPRFENRGLGPRGVDLNMSYGF
jgi:membrane-associated phospholipid phosphatase